MTGNRDGLEDLIDEELLLVLRRKAKETNRNLSDVINDAIEYSLAGDVRQEFLEEDLGVRDETTGTGNPVYYAFISYSHADEKIAAATHKFLERFRVPRTLIGRETDYGKVPARIRPVFRDQDEFPASADLGRAIQKALNSARALIVICSPRSARSQWVGEEIRRFKQLGRSDRIYCLNVEGDPVSVEVGDSDQASFHPALLEHFDDRGRQLDGEGIEPLAVALNEHGLSTAGVKLAAGVLGVGYDDLYQRVRRQRLRTRSLLAGLTAVVLVTGTWLFVDGLQEKQLNRAQQLAIDAKQEIFATQPLAGLALAVHALELVPQRAGAGYQTILQTVRELAIQGRVASLGNNVENVVVNMDGTRLAVDHADENGELRSATTGKLIQELVSPIYKAKFLEHTPGYLVTDYRWSGADLRFATSGERVAQLKSPVTGVTFAHNHFFVRYSGGHPNELRRISDGALVPLAENVKISQIDFSRNPDAPLMAVEYYNDHGPELRRTDDGSVVELAGKPIEIQFSQDAETTRILITYDDRSTELLRTADLSLVQRFDGEQGQMSFVVSLGSPFVQARGDGAVTLFKASDGSFVFAGNKIFYSWADSHAAVLAKDRVEWFRGGDGKRLGSVDGDFKDLRFSRESPSSRLALQRDDGWELRKLEDGSLVTESVGAEKVHLDIEYFFVKGKVGAEIRRLDDGSLVSSLGKDATGASYPSPGVLEVRLGKNKREFRRLSSGHLIKAPRKRNIKSDAVVGPGSEYQLIGYVNNKTDLKRSANGKTS